MMAHKAYRQTLLLVFLVLLPLLGIACSEDGTSGGQGGADATTVPGTPLSGEAVDPLPPVPPAPPAQPPRAPACTPGEWRSWVDSSRYVGSQVSIIGPVRELRQANGATEIEIGDMNATPADVVTVVIPDLSRSAFPGSPETIVGNAKTICAIGVVEMVGGRLQMTVNLPTNLVVL